MYIFISEQFLNGYSKQDHVEYEIFLFLIQSTNVELFDCPR